MGVSAWGTLDTPLPPAPPFLRYRIAVSVSAEKQGGVPGRPGQERGLTRLLGRRAGRDGS